MTDPTKPIILFLCVHNAGRSQMAAGFARALGGDRVVVYSAGTAPGEVLNPSAVAVMLEKGIDISTQAPTALTPEMNLAADVIITMGCGDECTYYPGKRYLDWALDDPAGQGVEAVRPIRDDIEQRVIGLLSELLK